VPCPVAGFLQGKLEADGSADFQVGSSTFKLTPAMVTIKKEMTRVGATWGLRDARVGARTRAGGNALVGAGDRLRCAFILEACTAPSPVPPPPTPHACAQVTGRSFVPGVIEPSFGIGRIMYCMFEHTYSTREVGAGCG